MILTTGRQTLLLLDGTHDKDSIFTKLMDLVKHGEIVVRKSGGVMGPDRVEVMIREQLGKCLSNLAKSGLLIA